MKMLKSLTRKRIWVAGAFMLLWVLDASGHRGALRAAELAYIDTHSHPPTTPSCTYDPDYDGLIQKVLEETMEPFNIQKELFMPPPHSLENLPSCNYEHLAEVAKRRRDRFAFLLGGETLNPMIQKVVKGETSLKAMQPLFVKRAMEILQSGAIGFGEMAAEHFSLHKGHPYMSAPPDHPLFLLLADIAADHDVPIDLHMEAITKKIQRDALCDISNVCDEDTKNPETFGENIEAFERLLNYNPDARIVWVHAGWDNTGHRTVELMSRLLTGHPNLYMNFKLRGPGQASGNRPLDTDGNLKPQWLDLIRSFPDRFTIGTDAKFGGVEDGDDIFKMTRALLDKLPTDLAVKVGLINPACIYDLGLANACIDIKPGSYPNSINLKSSGTVPVAIMSTRTFDATTVDPTTVTLAGAPVRRLKGKGTPMASFEDVNGDGLLDLVVHVSAGALQLTETDTEALLEGQTFDGTSVIRGRDTVRVVP